MFSMNFAKSLRAISLENNSAWLLLEREKNEKMLMLIFIGYREIKVSLMPLKNAQREIITDFFTKFLQQTVLKKKNCILKTNLFWQINSNFFSINTKF